MLHLKARSYSFTINNDTYDDLYVLLLLDFKYLIIGFEKGDNGTPHIQGYIQFYSARYFNSIKPAFPRAHLEISRGTSQQNIDYCMKDNNYYEFGHRPTSGGRVTYEQVEDAFNNPKDNMTIIRQYGKAYEYVRQQDIQAQDIKTKFYVIKPEFDALTEILEYIGQDEDLIVIQSVNELAAYDSEDLSCKSVVLLYPYLDYLIPLYARGIPIKYKYGFQYHTAKPKHFIVVTDQATLGRLTGYKRI